MWGIWKGFHLECLTIVSSVFLLASLFIAKRNECKAKWDKFFSKFGVLNPENGAPPADGDAGTAREEEEDAGSVPVPE
jgi:hypothetical protein